MAIVYKGMTRPAMFKGVPIVPLICVVGGFFLLGLYFSKLLWLLIFVAYFIMRMMAKKDDYIFNLFFLKLKMKGNPIANRHFKINSVLGSQYDGVDISEFLNDMKLNNRTPLEKYIPYSSQVDESIVKTKSGDYIVTWELMGAAFESQSFSDLDLSDRQFATLIRSFSGTPVTFYVHNGRESFNDAFDSNSGNPFADKVSDLYNDGIRNNTFKRNRLYLTLAYRPHSGLEKAEQKKLSLKQKKDSISDNIQTVKGFINTVTSSIEKFSPNILSTYTDKGATFSNQLSFYHYLITGIKQKVRVTNYPIYSYLGGSDLFFGADTGEIKGVKGSRFFRSIEIKDFVPETASGVFDALLYTDAEYIITHSFSLMSKSEALGSIRQTEKQLASTEDDAVSQFEQLAVAKDELVAGNIAFGKYHFSLMVYADSLAELQKDVSDISSMFTDLGFITSISSLSLPAAFMAQMPGVYHLRPRLAPVSSRNFVELASLHNFYQGKRDQNPWGEAVAILKTPSGSPYYLNFHHSTLFKDELGEKNLGNTMVIGTAGTGKTMLLSFINCMLQKYNNPQTFAPDAATKRITTVFLDKDRGAELCVRALGGEYFVVKNGEPTGWNPFSLDNTPANADFIKSLVKLLCTRNGNKVNTREERLISDSVDDVLAMPVEYRAFGITRMMEHMTQSNDKEALENGILTRLEQWSSERGGQYAWVFDNAEDTFSFNEASVIGIDGTEFLDNANVAPAISFFLLYRIGQLLDGRRLVLFMDEFWKWLQSEAFADFAYNKLKTIRKQNGFVIPATQSPDEILKSDISRAVIEQCGTSIFLANDKADYNDYVDGFKVTPEEFEIIRNIDPTSRQFLIKKSSLIAGDGKAFSALVTLDLKGLGIYTKILSASTDNIDIFESIFTPGMKTNDWLDTFLKKAV